jgi:hypothetical protein
MTTTGRSRILSGVRRPLAVSTVRTDQSTAIPFPQSDVLAKLVTCSRFSTDRLGGRCFYSQRVVETGNALVLRII